MNIVEAIKDRNLFRPFLGEDLTSWKPWMAVLRATYGLPIESKNGRRVIQETAGRNAALLPPEGFDTACYLVGRRSGKSRISAVIGAFEAVLSGKEKLLDVGEPGIVAVLSPTKRQSKVVHGYLRSIFEASPMLRRKVVRETANTFELSNNVSIEVMAGDFKSVRGYSMLAAIVDEICFMGHTEESKVKSDLELIRAIRPALARPNGTGRLVTISSVYARKGWGYQQWKRHHGKDDSKTLVLRSPSRVLNPLLPQKVIDEALAEDFAAARAEFYSDFREDLSPYLDRTLLEAMVVKGRDKLRPGQCSNLNAFCDIAGGASGGDDACLAITSRSDRKIVLALAESWSPPFAPQRVIAEMATVLKQYGIKRVVGDRYSAQFAVEAFRMSGIHYVHSEMPRSELYLECLPKLTSGEVELLDNDRLIDQFANLERKTRSGGRDIVDHPPGGHDDLSNAVAGAIAHAVQTSIRVGGFGPKKDPVPKEFRIKIDTNDFQGSFLEVLNGQKQFKVTQHHNIF